MGNPFVWVELGTTDVDKAKSFYGQLFDWKFDTQMMGDMPYTMIGVGEGTGGGMMKHPVPGAPSMWLAYVLVDDLEAATAKAKSLGAKVYQGCDCMEVPGYGALERYHGPDRGDARTMAAQEGLARATPCRYPVKRQHRPASHSNASAPCPDIFSKNSCSPRDGCSRPSSSCW